MITLDAHNGHGTTGLIALDGVSRLGYHFLDSQLQTHAHVTPEPASSSIAPPSPPPLLPPPLPLSLPPLQRGSGGELSDELHRNNPANESFNQQAANPMSLSSTTGMSVEAVMPGCKALKIMSYRNAKSLDVNGSQSVIFDSQSCEQNWMQYLENWRRLSNLKDECNRQLSMRNASVCERFQARDCGSRSLLVKRYQSLPTPNTLAFSASSQPSSFGTVITNSPETFACSCGHPGSSCGCAVRSVEQRPRSRPSTISSSSSTLVGPFASLSTSTSQQTPERNQKDNKYVDNIVDTTSMVIQSIWADQYAAKKTKLVSLRVFIQEVLRRSRTTYSTLQTALFYLFRVKNAIVTRLRSRAARELEHGPAPKIAGQHNEDDLIGCGRRMFLAALMVASKYLQDKNYRNRAWAKISGLSVHEINATEIAFLKLIDYKLFVSKPTFDRWYVLLHNQVAGAATGKDDQQPPMACIASDALFANPSSLDGSAECSSLSPPSSHNSPPSRVPSPSQIAAGSESEEGCKVTSDLENLKLTRDARVPQFVPAQTRLQRAPDSGVALYMSTPESILRTSPTPSEQAAVKNNQPRPIARVRHLAAAPVQSTNNVVVAPNISGVRTVVRTTSAAAAVYLPSPPTSENGKRKHVELMDDGRFAYASCQYESAVAAIPVPDVCSVPENKKLRADEEVFGFGYLEDTAVELY